jgi:hypothetical protein
MKMAALAFALHRKFAATIGRSHRATAFVEGCSLEGLRRQNKKTPRPHSRGVLDLDEVVCSRQIKSDQIDQPGPTYFAEVP